ncbi:MAG: hypothetical protein GX751_07475 [Desulfuromonadaceae bacterium]|nr:hypothetical protein [Desulfuromonadaceae bacterium]
MENEDRTYPLEEEDLKRRVAGEVLRAFEQRGKMPPVPEVVQIVETVCLRVSTLMQQEEIPLHRIDLGKQVESYLKKRQNDPEKTEAGA